MKRRRILLALVFSLSVFTSSAIYAASGVDISSGAMSWYTWWKPGWSDGEIFVPPAFPGSDYQNPFSLPSGINTFESDPALMYGPTV